MKRAKRFCRVAIFALPELTAAERPCKTRAMKRTALTLAILAAIGAVTFAGPEPFSGKEMKQVAPAPPPECNWQGFYLGLSAGGTFGDTHVFDVDAVGAPAEGIPAD